MRGPKITKSFFLYSIKNLINSFEKFKFSDNVGFVIHTSNLPSTFTVLGTKNKHMEKEKTKQLFLISFLFHW